MDTLCGKWQLYVVRFGFFQTTNFRREHEKKKNFGDILISASVLMCVGVADLRMCVHRYLNISFQQEQNREATQNAQVVVGCC